MGAVAQTQLVLSCYALVETTVHNSSLGDIFTNIHHYLANIGRHSPTFVWCGAAAAALGKVYSIGISSSGSGRVCTHSSHCCCCCCCQLELAPFTASNSAQLTSADSSTIAPPLSLSHASWSAVLLPSLCYCLVYIQARVGITTLKSLLLSSCCVRETGHGGQT